MSHMSGTNSGNASRQPFEFTEITDNWEVPSANLGRYTVMIRRPTGTQPFTQPFPVSAGDTIRKRKVDSTRAIVRNSSQPSRNKIIPVYADDLLVGEYTIKGEPRITRIPFPRDRPDIIFNAMGTRSLWLHCPSMGVTADRHVADLRTGDHLEVEREPLWNLELESVSGNGPYVIGTLGPYEQAGWVKYSEDNSQDDSITRQSDAIFRDRTGRRV
jgi:hypothetical protein